MSRRAVPCDAVKRRLRKGKTHVRVRIEPPRKVGDKWVASIPDALPPSQGRTRASACRNLFKAIVAIERARMDAARDARGEADEAGRSVAQAARGAREANSPVDLT